MATSSYTIAALERGLHVLSLFDRERPEMALSEIQQAAAISKSTAYRIAYTLQEAGYLERDPETKRYRPALKVLQLGFTAISSLEIRQVAIPFLRRLSAAVGETVSLSVLDGMEVVYVDRVRSRQIVGVVLGAGSRIAAHCASMGKAMLAYLPPEELERRLRGLELAPCTARSLATGAALAAELEQVRRQGYAVNDEELERGLRAVAAPIWNRQQQVVAAINISGATHRVSRQRLTRELAPAVRQAAAEISQALGSQQDGD